jgi:hypothetical protein
MVICDGKIRSDRNHLFEAEDRMSHDQTSNEVMLNSFVQQTPGNGMSEEFFDPATLISIFTGIKQMVAMCRENSGNLQDAGRLAERSRNPTPADKEQLWRISKLKTKQNITRRNNPTGGKISRRERNILRDSYARRVYQASLDSGAATSATSMEGLIEELRGEDQ